MQLFKVSKLEPKQKAQRDYVVHWAKNPDKGSLFARITFLIRWLPAEWLFFLLVKCLRYDGFIFYEGSTLIGHIFFQKHWKEWRVFSFVVVPELRGKKHSRNMLAAFLQEAHDDIRLAGVRIGAGRHEIMKHLCDVAIQKKLDLPFSVYSGRCAGMLDFKPPLFQKSAPSPLLSGNIKKL
ncbi:MAG: GNAT family N-acetyltransferase [Patescibacteria group bacterium]